MNNPSSSTQAQRAGVRVIVRQRPQSKVQQENDYCVKQSSNTSLELRNPRNQDEMIRCLGPRTTQQYVFEHEIIPFVEHAIAGYNASCFCYGPTGAGKTHTMQGSDKDPGIIPRAVEAILRIVNEEQAKGTYKNHKITMSYLELYNEKIFDLLEPKSCDLPIRENEKHQIIVPNLAEVVLSDIQQFCDRFSNALAKRKLAPTKLNSKSSRSHAILMIKIRKLEAFGSERQINGKLHLVDLAGSEDNRRTGNVGIRMKESGAINSSLFVLGKVVDALNANHRRIPYRDSKLTRLLQDSLGGTSHACMILNIAPAAEQYQETLSGLSFASKSRNIVNLPKFNTVQPVSSSCTSHFLGSKVKPDLAPPARVVKGIKRKAEVAGFNNSKHERSEKEIQSEFKRRLLSTETSLVTDQLSSTDSQAALERRLLTKMESMIQEMYDHKSAKKDSQAIQLSIVPTSKSAKLGIVESDEIPQMTPGSKMMVAKAVLNQAKICKEQGKLKAALEYYRQAHKLLPHKAKLKTIINDLEQDIRQRDAKPNSILSRPAWGRQNPPKARKRLALANISNSRTSEVPQEESLSDPEWVPLEDDLEDEDVKPKKKQFRSNKTPTAMLDTPEPPIELTEAERIEYRNTLISVLNHGGIKQLLNMNGIGKKRAESIVNFRENERLFNKIEDLRLCGFGDKVVNTFVEVSTMILNCLKKWFAL